ncbi:MAG: cation transporter [Sphingomonadales bacterium]|jgi:Co/Zn/Cd efflux system component|uniref:cation transporter n=1 Tax=Sphingomonadales TaxID=204457 RepID=UPI001566B3EC|nr:cation transporter [Sphingopyxis sp. BSNA05]MBQ0772916.1 cation transporter [Sphingomonadales bacterium]NRD89580.1 cation transporter [Sphingopyxis sp. BSNA05]|tara:strand:- start:5439 stop:6077 length:639 start_codon:yes stop_codon:yes gene_type:complete
MVKSCCQPPDPAQSTLNNPRWRVILWIALVANAAMFVVEIIAGVAADSRALQADALDFFGDAANYAISLGVAGMALAWRARAALFKAATMLAFGLWVIGYAIYGLVVGSSPEPQTMGLIGTLALIVNIAVALLLFRYREGDANMRSVWICSRNDAIGNIAVLAAALGVFGTGQAWPDLLVAGVMAGLAIWGSVEVFNQARGELVTQNEGITR